MEALASLAAGVLPPEFPFPYESAFDARSPYSLILAFFPETEPLSVLDFKISTLSSDKLDGSVGEFVTSELQKLGWNEENCKSDSVKSFFLKVWLRKTDRTYRQLVLPSNLEGTDTLWTEGTVRILQLYRRLSNEINGIDLSTFEGLEAEEAFEMLMSFRPSGWGLRQRIEFLVLPYLRYKSRLDLLEAWILHSKDLASVKESVFVPELAGSLIEMCLRSSLEDWRLVKHVVENIKPVEQGILELTSASQLSHSPTIASLDFISDLTEVAMLENVMASSFRQLAEWSFGPVQMQEDVLIRFLRMNTRLSLHELAVLRRTVLSKVDESFVIQESVRAALRASRFSFVRSHLMPSHSEIVKQEVMAMVASFDALSPEVSLKQLVTVLQLLDDEPELLKKYRRLEKIQAEFGLEPSFVLTHDPLDNVARALELKTDAYLHYSDLVKYVSGEEFSSKVAELCVESALADDNFEAVVDFIDRAFVDKESPTAWLAYYQAGKFISPSWDLPRDPKVVETQLKYLSISLSTCPEGDILSILRTWTSTEKEFSESSAFRKPAVVEKPRSPPSSQEASLETPARHSGEGTRDHISSLLVSGIGWAIGANK